MNTPVQMVVFVRLAPYCLVNSQFVEGLYARNMRG